MMRLQVAAFPDSIIELGRTKQLAGLLFGNPLPEMVDDSNTRTISLTSTAFDAEGFVIMHPWYVHGVIVFGAGDPPPTDASVVTIEHARGPDGTDDPEPVGRRTIVNQTAFPLTLTAATQDAAVTAPTIPAGGSRDVRIDATSVHPIAVDAAVADGAVTADKIADNAVTREKLEHVTRGAFATYDASGAPVYIAAGAQGQVPQIDANGDLVFGDQAVGGGGGGSVAVRKDGAEVVAAASVLNFGSGLAVTSPAAGVVDITLDGFTVNAQTGADYTLTRADAFDVVTMDHATANTVRIPAHATEPFGEPVIIAVIQKGAGQTTVALDEPTAMLNGVPGGSAVISAQWAPVSLLWLGPDEWAISGAHGGVA